MNDKDVISYLREHKSEFEQAFGVRRIGVFGSYATGRHHENSDIDIVVELKKPDILTLVGIKHKIEDELGRKVDIIRYRDRMNSMLKNQIDTYARYA
jgi:predicted nucleotidyltransferase